MSTDSDLVSVSRSLKKTIASEVHLEVPDRQEGAALVSTRMKRFKRNHHIVVNMSVNVLVNMPIMVSLLLLSGHNFCLNLSPPFSPPHLTHDILEGCQ